MLDQTAKGHKHPASLDSRTWTSFSRQTILYTYNSLEDHPSALTLTLLCSVPSGRRLNKQSQISCFILLLANAELQNAVGWPIWLEQQSETGLRGISSPRIRCWVPDPYVKSSMTGSDSAGNASVYWVEVKHGYCPQELHSQSTSFK